MGRIYTFVNQKGGVGKTTTAINVGAFIANEGLRVLLVDIDPQANATSCLGIDKHSINGGTYEAILGISPALSHVLHNKKLKLSLLPSSPALTGAEVELVEISDRETRLRESLIQIQEQYDYIFVDCPPSLGLLTLNGIVAALDGVLIPVQCEYLALEGISQLTHTLNRVRSALFPELSIRGVILTMFDARTNLSKDVVEEVRRYFPEQVMETIIPRSIRLAEAPSYGLPISTYAPSSSGARAYQNLAHEILAGDGVAINTSQE